MKDQGARVNEHRLQQVMNKVIHKIKTREHQRLIQIVKSRGQGLMVSQKDKEVGITRVNEKMNPMCKDHKDIKL